MARRRVPTAMELERTRVCVQCGVSKPWADFSPNRRGPDGQVMGVKPRCNECVAANSRAATVERRKERQPQNGRGRIPDPSEWIRTKRCPNCKKTKPWALYSPLAYWPDGSVRRVQSWCRECRAQQSRGKRRPMTPHRLAYLREWKRRNKVAFRKQSSAGNAGRDLPVEPLRAWLLGLLRVPDGYPDEHTMALAAGIEGVRGVLARVVWLVRSSYSGVGDYVCGGGSSRSF